ncbi:MAG TPA: AEC family transporter, partial [Rhizobiaceae bacterium]|nr:AEC family transporter [Rhizobiaceae bacterium]
VDKLLSIAAITAPIFLIIAVGYLTVRTGIVDKATNRALGAFALYIALPALIFRALAQRSIGEIVRIDYLIAYASASLVVFALVFATARLLRGETMTGSAIRALGGSVSNSGFIGYPVAAMVLGDIAGVALALNMVVENIIMIPLSLTLAEVGMQGSERMRGAFLQSFRRLLRNPFMISIFFGLVFALSGLALPEPIFRTIDMLATAAGPVALFVIGGTLVGIRIKSMVFDLVTVSVAKLLLHPLLVFSAFMLIGVADQDLVTAAVLFASVPVITVYAVLGERFGEGEICAAILLAGTTASFFTVTGLIWLMHYLGRLPSLH